MSGHSKWSTIKRKKGAADEKRGKLFTTLIKEITVAARMGGGDESANSRLRQAVEKAKAANMPRDNVERAIKKGTGELPGVNYEEIIYEGFGPGGVAILMEVLTDNKNRTVADIRHLMSKYGGNLGESGSVSWMFEKQGQIVVDKQSADEDMLFEISLECGADDFTAEDDAYIVSTSPSALLEVKGGLESHGISVKSFEIEMVPTNLVNVDIDTAEKLIKLLNVLEENDDIKNIHANFDMDDQILQEE